MPDAPIKIPDNPLPTAIRPRGDGGDGPEPPAPIPA